MDKIYKDFSEFTADYKYDEISDKLGEGGFATVYRADDMLRNREVVVKVSKVPKDEKYSLMHEFQIVKALPIHKNVVYYESCHRFKLSGLGVFDVAIMDFYPLGNLENFLNQRKVASDEFTDLVKETLLGISFLHQNSIIHRDIKPANILIAEYKGKFIPKIADFGLGKVKGSSEESFTDNSFVGGTLNYAAPEQILGSKVRPNVDLWSFGVLLYKMCTDKIPFYTSETNTTGRREQLIKKIVQAELPADLKFVNEPFQTLIRRCLVVDNEKRVKTADELIELMNTIKIAEKTEIFVPSPVQNSKKESALNPVINKNKTKNITNYFMLGAAVVLAFMVIGWIAYDSTKNDDEKPNDTFNASNHVLDKENKDESSNEMPNDTFNASNSILDKENKDKSSRKWNSYLLIVNENGKFGLTNIKGGVMLDVKYEEIQDEGIEKNNKPYHWVKENKKYRLIQLPDFGGIKVSKTKFDEVKSINQIKKQAEVIYEGEERIVILDELFGKTNTKDTNKPLKKKEKDAGFIKDYELNN